MSHKHFQDINNLIKLLDVSSQETRETVYIELSKRAQLLETFLKEQTEPHSPEVMYILDNICQKHRNSKLRKHWLNWLSFDNEYLQMEGALSFLSQVQQEPNKSIELSKQLDQLQQDFINSSYEETPIGLNQFLFVEGRLEGATHQYYHPKHSDLCHVLSRGRGLPISLVSIFMLVGFRLDFHIQGFNLPGHFMAKTSIKSKPVLIDCFNRGKVLSNQDMSTLSLSSRLDFYHLLAHPPTSIDMVRRVLQNLGNAYIRMGLIEHFDLVQSLMEDLQAANGSQLAPIGFSPDPKKTTFFKKGQLIQHRRYGYRGVIVDRDLGCQLEKENRNPTNTVQPTKNQPWYHILVDQSNQTTYAAQSSLRADSSGVEIHHPLIKKYFCNFHDGKYNRNDVPWHF